MRTIIVTIKPIHLGNIRRGIKEFEIRKTAPEFPFRALCCESQSGGRITAEFVCDRVIPINVFGNGSIQDWMFNGLARACIGYKEMAEYIGNGKTGYAWHISEMVDYCSTKGRTTLNVRDFGLKRAPQSWQYVPDGRC